MSEGVVKCICPHMTNQEEDLKGMVRDNEEMIFLHLLSLTFRVHVFSLQPNENKLGG